MVKSVPSETAGNNVFLPVWLSRSFFFKNVKRRGVSIDPRPCCQSPPCLFLPTARSRHWMMMTGELKKPHESWSEGSDRGRRATHQIWSRPRTTWKTKSDKKISDLVCSHRKKINLIWVSLWITPAVMWKWIVLTIASVFSLLHSCVSHCVFHCSVCRRRLSRLIFVIWEWRGQNSQIPAAIIIH